MSFFKFLSYYGLSSTNIASFDEYILDLSQKLGVESIKIDNGIYDLIFEEFIREKNIIISGTAGDGKTYLLRRLFFEWGNSKEFREFIPKANTKNFVVYFVKDFTELNKEDKLDILKRLEKSVFEKSNERFVIAANDGILIDSLKEFKMNNLLNLVEDLIDNKEHKKLALFDLFQTSAARNFELLLDEVIKRAKKVKCNYKDCVIHKNIELLENETIKKQLLKIIRISDLNYEHLTFRKLYMIIANMILGHQKGVFSSCKEANEYYKNKDKIKSAFYNNLFADNLSESSKEKFKSFLELNIGKESSNIIDEKILYEDLKLDGFFNVEKFKKIRDKYFEDNENYNELNEYLVYLRRFLFFTDEELAKDLIIYKYLDEFIEIVDNEKIPKKLLQKIVVALNRIFLGEFVEEDSELFIASSFTNSFAKISDEIIDKLSTRRDIKVEIIPSKIDKNFKKVYLVIKDKKLEIDLHMYEFLRRVSEGILPLSFSTEYYEKVLNFKSKLLSNEEIEDFELFEVENFRVIIKDLGIE